ncbi:MAG TPA: ribonuclease PH [Chthoniobacterales bacterium]|nr:ribonuclease PH [Chthoniobacterales bacterium]
MTNESGIQTATARPDGRAKDQLRPVTFTPGIAPNADGSVLIATGKTQVLCAATIEAAVPRWMKDQGVKGGWITAEYSMLPYSTLTRRPRDISRGKPDGRSIEIQRLIGRALRAAVDLEVLGERTLWVDCDVLQADAGTRTASITGSCVAIALAFASLLKCGDITHWPLRALVAAVSVGVVEKRLLLDLNYEEDKDAAVDMNLVMTNKGEFIEVQGAGEEATFSREEFDGMIALGQSGIERLIAAQREILQASLGELPEF